MKKLIKIVGIIFLFFVVAAVGMFFRIKSTPIPEVAVANVNLDMIEDGTYHGEYSEGLVKVVVQVQVEDHKYAEIELKEHQNGLGSKAEKIIDQIMAQQSLNVDLVSGATLSSNVIRRAIQEALTK